MNEVRQILTAHAGQSLMDERNVLHITLANAIDASLDAPQKFNAMSAVARVRIARQALAQAGAINVREAPGSMNLVEGAPARAMDAKPRQGCSHDGIFGHVCGPSGISEGPDKISAEDAAVFRGLLKRLKARKLRGTDREPRDTRHNDLENRVSADSATAAQERQVRQTRDFGYKRIDEGSRMGRTTRVMDSSRPLDHTGRPMSDLEYYRRAAFETSGGVS
jgi:hypothetical protein